MRFVADCRHYLYFCAKLRKRVNLIIDRGNTMMKLAVFDADRLEAFVSYDCWDRLSVDEFLSGYSTDACIYSSVAGEDDEIVDFFQSRISRFHRFSTESRLPVQIGYRTPETLGLDRIAGVVGASCENPGMPILVIDAGTAITYDVVTEDGLFIGGNIAPGLQMRLRALHAFTSRLPEVSAEGEIPRLGCDTDTAIRSGVVQGICYEMEGYIQELTGKYPGLLVFLTGGDAFLFAERLKTPIFVDKNIVIKGLNRILYCNVKK